MISMKYYYFILLFSQILSGLQFINHGLQILMNNEA